jgi:ferredoxin
MYKISMNDVEKLFQAIAESDTLYLPIEKGGEVEFYPYEEDAKVRLDVLHTVKSAKDAFLPTCENMMMFKMDGKNIELKEAKRVEDEFVVFGVRACDVRSFAILDKVYLSDPVDSFYAARREHGVVVSTACSRPEETCFCTKFDIDATEPEGDVVTWIADGVLYWEPKTDKGAALTEKVKAVLEESDSAAVEKQKADTKQILDKLPLNSMDMEYLKGADMMTLFKSEKWEELYQSCLGCGTCTFVCPTCQCYDIRDYDNGNEIVRYRCWDSCMYRDFTMMAHGTNRKTQLERFRQRFMHKLSYFPINNDGQFGCVGCGRCISKCPISMNITKVIKTLGGDNS